MTMVPHVLDCHRCLVDVPGEKLPADLPDYLRTTVAPEVPEQLRDAFLEALESSHIRTMQNKQLYATPLHQPGKGSVVAVRSSEMYGMTVSIMFVSCFALNNPWEADKLRHVVHPCSLSQVPCSLVMRSTCVTH